jgi:DNA-binding response OmpR family regulator|tara:strand:- start:68 stop:430 length:363 start_codon:yes stop_codon:yes gene_type:complete
MNCLIVDDCNVTLFVTRNILETLNYDVYTAKNCADALAHLENEKIDIVITDIHLGHESGIDLIKVIKADKAYTFPVVALTGVEDEAKKSEILAAGADDYLQKPTTLDKLRVSIDKVGLPI